MMNFVSYMNKACLYKVTKKKKLALIAVYVDDITIECNEKSGI